MFTETCREAKMEAGGRQLLVQCKKELKMAPRKKGSRWFLKAQVEGGPCHHLRMGKVGTSRLEGVGNLLQSSMLCLGYLAHTATEMSNR